MSGNGERKRSLASNGKLWKGERLLWIWLVKHGKGEQGMWLWKEVTRTCSIWETVLKSNFTFPWRSLTKSSLVVYPLQPVQQVLIISLMTTGKIPLFLLSILATSLSTYGGFSYQLVGRTSSQTHVPDKWFDQKNMVSIYFNLSFIHFQIFKW